MRIKGSTYSASAFWSSDVERQFQTFEQQIVGVNFWIHQPLTNRTTQSGQIANDTKRQPQKSRRQPIDEITHAAYRHLLIPANSVESSDTPPHLQDQSTGNRVLGETTAETPHTKVHGDTTRPKGIKVIDRHSITTRLFEAQCHALVVAHSSPCFTPLDQGYPIESTKTKKTTPRFLKAAWQWHQTVAQPHCKTRTKPALGITTRRKKPNQKVGLKRCHAPL